MKKVLVALVLIVCSFVPVAAVKAEASGLPPAINCNVLIFKPAHYWRQGVWIPERLPKHMTVREWYNACKNRLNGKKRDPDVPDGPWRVNIKLNPGNCTYKANQDIKDYGWWLMARFVVS